MILWDKIQTRLKPKENLFYLCDDHKTIRKYLIYQILVYLITNIQKNAHTKHCISCYNRQFATRRDVKS